MATFAPQRISPQKDRSPPTPAPNPSDKSTDIDETPWEPQDDFGELFIRVNSNHEVIVSGPPDQVAAIKEKVLSILSETRHVPIPSDIERIEFNA